MNLSKLAILFLAMGLVAFAGCGKADPTKPEEPKPGEKKDPGGTSPTTTPGGGTPTPGGVTPIPPAPLGPSLLKHDDTRQDMVVRFTADLSAAADLPGLMKQMSPQFLKVIGKPLYTDADKALGYSADMASASLRRTSVQLATSPAGLPIGYGSPSAAVFVGSFGNRTGRTLIRLVFTDGWKVDWFSLGTLEAPGMNPTTTEGSYQDFAVLAFVDALTGNASSKDDRVQLLAAVLSAKLRQSWAEPFDGDKAQGRDFNSTKLGLKLDEYGAGVTAFTRVQAEGDAFKVELSKGPVKTAYTVKLVKGTTPGEWLVDEFTKQ